MPRWKFSDPQAPSPGPVVGSATHAGDARHGAGHGAASWSRKFRVWSLIVVFFWEAAVFVSWLRGGGLLCFLEAQMTFG